MQLNCLLKFYQQFGHHVGTSHSANEEIYGGETVLLGVAAQGYTFSRSVCRDESRAKIKELEKNHVGSVIKSKINRYDEYRVVIKRVDDFFVLVV